MRFLPILGLSASFAVAQASFDMILQADNDTSLGAHIDRYDPINRVFLGSFPIIAAALGPGNMAVSRARQELYIRSTTNLVRAYNYSTGEYVRSIPLLSGQLAVSDDSATLHSATGNSINSLNLATGTVTNRVLSGISNITGLALSVGGRFLVCDAGSGTFRSYTSTGTFIASVPAVNGVVNLTERVETGDPSPTFRGVIPAGNSTIVGVTDLGGSLTEVTTATPYSRVNSLVEAHEGMWVLGETTAAPGTLRYGRMDSSGFMGATFAMTQTTSLTGATAIVLAPEPGTMLALGGGLVWFLKRRKRG